MRHLRQEDRVVSAGVLVTQEALAQHRPRRDEREAMTWVPPFFTCGECGGEIGRYPMRNLLRQDILDWRHRTVPAGVGEHRAVLGTPAHKPTLLESLAPEEEGEVPAEHEVPAPELRAVLSADTPLPRAATSIEKLAKDHGWAVEAWTWRGTLMDARWRPSRVRSTVCLRMVRAGHGLAALWVTDAAGDWEFDVAYSVTHYTEEIGSPELRKIIQFPRVICETCGENLTLHHVVPGGFLCHAEFQARQALVTAET
jgi:hypothetical protein